MILGLECADFEVDMRRGRLLTIAIEYGNQIL
jgi:hypothetical protein